MKGNNFWTIALIIVLIFIYSNSTTPTTPSTPATPSTPQTDLSQLIDSGAAFNVENFFLTGTPITGEQVRIIKLNGGGELKDLSAVSTDGGTLNTKPNDKYKFYFFMNDSVPSLTYYVQPKDYTAPLQDAVDNVYGKGCTIDSSLIFNSYNKAGQRQTATTNAQSVTTSDDMTLTISITNHINKCYGNPNIEKNNAICFAANAGIYTILEANTPIVPTPASVLSMGQTASKVVRCYEMPKLKNNQNAEMYVHLVAGATEPTSANGNITIVSDDISLDLNRQTFAEIVGYVDEDSNQLGANTTYLGKIYIS